MQTRASVRTRCEKECLAARFRATWGVHKRLGRIEAEWEKKREMGKERGRDNRVVRGG